MKRPTRGRWRRRRAGPRLRRPAATLAAAEAYRLWSATYAEETNELQRLEADLRRHLTMELRDLLTLEVGAGTGRVTEELLSAGADVFATDLVSAMLSHSPIRSVMTGRTCVARAEALPFRSRHFDLVVCALTLGHVADLPEALDSMAEVLRPGGALIITGFHPFATLQGWKRSFSYKGEECSVEQHVHLLGEYFRTLRDLACPIEDLQERTWEGIPVVFGLRARKAASSRRGPGG